MEMLKDAPGGKWAVLESTIEGVEVVAVGYKYNTKKVLFFAMTKGAGSTEPGEPYVVKFPDSYGNPCSRHDERPAFLTRYFGNKGHGFSNLIDFHNQERQDTLALEEAWVTEDPWFRIFTTGFGMNTVDTHHALQAMGAPSGIWKKRPLMQFVDVLVYQLLNNAHDKGAGVHSARQAAHRASGGGAAQKTPAVASSFVSLG